MVDVVELKKLVKQLSQAGTDKELLSIISALKSGFVVNENVLRETKAGLAVGKLRNHASKDVSEAAKDLVKKWKNDVGKASAAPSRKASTASAATVSAPATAASAKKGNVRSTKTDLNGPVKHTGDATRDKCIELIYDGLALDSTMTPSALLSVSTTVEAAVYAAHDQITGAGYKQRIRMMFSNLKDMKNPQLRERVASGDIEPARFAIMSSQEMASDERKKEVERIKDENLFKSLAAEDQQAETDGFQCGRCKQRKCVYRQAQTRSADEPMTTFVTCTNCGHKWKFS